MGEAGKFKTLFEGGGFIVEFFGTENLRQESEFNTMVLGLINCHLKNRPEVP